VQIDAVPTPSADDLSSLNFELYQKQVHNSARMASTSVFAAMKQELQQQQQPALAVHGGIAAGSVVRDAVCSFSNCNKVPVFGWAGSKPTRCRTHRADGMYDLSFAHCIHIGCGMKRLYGFQGQKAVVCFAHRADNMVQISSGHALCEVDDCLSKPFYAVLGEKALRCLSHKTAGMIDVRHSQCSAERCFARATCSLAAQPLQFCGAHMQPGCALFAAHKRLPKLAVAAPPATVAAAASCGSNSRSSSSCSRAAVAQTAFWERGAAVAQSAAAQPAAIPVTHTAARVRSAAAADGAVSDTDSDRTVSDVDEHDGDVLHSSAELHRAKAALAAAEAAAHRAHRSLGNSSSSSSNSGSSSSSSSSGSASGCKAYLSAKLVTAAVQHTHATVKVEPTAGVEDIAPSVEPAYKKQKQQQRARSSSFHATTSGVVIRANSSVMHTNSSAVVSSSSSSSGSGSSSSSNSSINRSFGVLRIAEHTPASATVDLQSSGRVKSVAAESQQQQQHQQQRQQQQQHTVPATEPAAAKKRKKRDVQQSSTATATAAAAAPPVRAVHAAAVANRVFDSSSEQRANTGAEQQHVEQAIARLATAQGLRPAFKLQLTTFLYSLLSESGDEHGLG
jgi:EsV-1-7 cysteine-rich motif